MTGKKQDSDVEAVEEFVGSTLEDPEVGADVNVITSPFSQQQLDERIEAGEGEAVRQELDEAAEGLKRQTRSGKPVLG